MREVVNLNYKWAYTKMVEEVPETMPVKWDFVNLPHSWNNIDGQDGGNDYYRGTCLYVKELDKADLPIADQYYLEFRGANSSAEVYVNGSRLAQHDGGYSTWRVNVSEALQDGKNLITVAVDNSENDRVYPQMADFTFYGGLYRDVNLIAVNNSHFDLGYYGSQGLRVTPQITLADNEDDTGNNNASAAVEIEVFLNDTKPGQEIIYSIIDAGGVVVAEYKTPADETIATLKVQSAHLWHGRQDPYLYTAEVKLVSGEAIIDNVSTRFGLRTFAIDPDQGFILNGRSYPLRGVSRHQDRWGFGNALLPEHHEEDMDLICEMGATTIRLAHYQHDQYFYDLCDERGMVVWAEIPYISKHMPNARDNTISQMRELVAQNYNHPSIVVWGLSNEISMSSTNNDDMIENHKILNDLVHEMDTTRLTTIACVSMCDINDPYVLIPDVVSYNHYFGRYGGDTSMNGPWFDNFHAVHPNIPIGCSEYGCEALNWHTSNPEQGDYTEEYQAYYHEELIKQFWDRPYLWATHVWNMFDFGADARNEGGENGQNHKGLVTFDRKYKKDSFYAYKAWLSDDAFVHICGKRYVDRVEDTTKITVYSNQPEVELFVNGRSIGKQDGSKKFFYFEVPNSGKSEIKAVAGDCRDMSTINKVDKFNETYKLREKGAILNWFDITEPEGYFSLNDKMSDIMLSPAGAAIMQGLMSKMTESMGQDKMAGFEMNENMMKMLGGFTLIRLTGLLGMTGVKFTREQLLELNNQLNQIKK